METQQIGNKDSMKSGDVDTEVIKTQHNTESSGKSQNVLTANEKSLQGAQKEELIKQGKKITNIGRTLPKKLVKRRNRTEITGDERNDNNNRSSYNKEGINEATVYIATTLGAGNLEYFLRRVVSKVNCNYGFTAPNVSGLHKR
ncbi:hypothetical protein FQA39_LY08725 [Lamprigera yunnana]|nr:hypothetical protein FQA39_LY08725 [Lamprigera yunnana]